MVSGRPGVRAFLRHLSAAGEHPAARQTRGSGSAVCLELLLHLDHSSGPGLEQLHRQQDRHHLRTQLVRSANTRLSHPFNHYTNAERLITALKDASPFTFLISNLENFMRFIILFFFGRSISNTTQKSKQ